MAGERTERADGLALGNEEVHRSDSLQQAEHQRESFPSVKAWAHPRCDAEQQYVVESAL